MAFVRLEEEAEFYAHCVGRIKNNDCALFKFYVESSFLEVKFASPESLVRFCRLNGIRLVDERGTKRNPVAVIDHSLAFDRCRESGKPQWFVVDGEVGKAFPSGRWESADGEVSA